MFRARRERFIEAMGPNSVAILLGARPATRSNDTEYPFRQDSDFWYLTGFAHPDAIAVLRSDSDNPYSLFVQPRDPDAETWTGRRPGVEGAKSEFGADAAFSVKEFDTRLEEVLRGVDRVYHRLGRDPGLDTKIFEAHDRARMRSRHERQPASEIVDPRSILHEMRIVKSEDELALMRRAAAISFEAHHRAARLARAGNSEYEIEAAINYEIRRAGAWGPAYSTIVGGGANATILHYITNDQALRAGELVLVDAGAEFQGYASDVTRTYPVDGRFEGARRDLYEAVLDAQLAGLEGCKPGATLVEIHQLALRRLVEGMIGLGLLAGSPEEVIEKETYRPFYMHGTSHWLGLDVHDAGAYLTDGAARRLEPGMVFTVEPGLYVSPDAENVPDELRGVGVRIEDDVVITSYGHENLNAAIPKRPAEIEAWAEQS